MPVTVPFGQRLSSLRRFAPPPQPQSKTAASVDTVDIERRRELASEGIRWHDLVRQNRYVGVLQDMFKRNGSDANGVITKPETYELYKLVTKDSYIYPIPDSQMKVKEGLYEQNKGYN